MPSFFCPSAKIKGDKIVIEDKMQVRHIKKSLRLKIDDEVTVFNEKQEGFRCLITSLGEEVTVKIKAKLKPDNVSGPNITVACAIPKKAKFDEIVDKLAQLGVDRIVPLFTERVIVKLEQSKENAKRERWQKIAKAAVEQSQGIRIPLIDVPKSIDDVLHDSGEFDLKLIPTLDGKRKSLKEIFQKESPARVLVLIGPEGDFSPQEVRRAKDSGFIPVTLGSSVLRVDTAAIAVVSFIKLHEDS